MHQRFTRVPRPDGHILGHISAQDDAIGGKLVCDDWLAEVLMIGCVASSAYAVTRLP
jgi:hypothetical protein